MRVDAKDMSFFTERDGRGFQSEIELSCGDGQYRRLMFCEIMNGVDGARGGKPS
jgi:hypothetical protein